MYFSRDIAGREQDIMRLFTKTFTASEGAAEGDLIGILAANLLHHTPDQDIKVFTAFDRDALIGAAIFTRLRYENDPRSVFILSPMAVVPDRQGQGVGQALLMHALNDLRETGTDAAITYGDPAFYKKVGFAPITEADAAPPLPLGHPEGWIGQSLTGGSLAPLQGVCTCVPALNDPAIW